MELGIGLHDSGRWMLALGLLSVWQGLGFALVLWACHASVLLALPYGIAVAVPSVAFTALLDRDGMKWLALAFFTLAFLPGWLLQRHITRAIQGNWPWQTPLPVGVLCAAPLAGPVIAVMTSVAIGIIRRRNRLNLWD